GHSSGLGDADNRLGGVAVSLQRQGAADADADRDQEVEKCAKGPPSKRGFGGWQQFVLRLNQTKPHIGCRVLGRGSHPLPPLRLLKPTSGQHATVMWTKFGDIPRSPVPTRWPLCRKLPDRSAAAPAS